MAIQRPDPLRSLADLQETMNRLFDDVLTRTAVTGGNDEADGGWKPPVDLYEADDRYLLRIDLPGVRADDVRLDVEGDTLKLQGERPADPDVPREAYLRVERPRGPFHLELSLPPSVERAEIKATHREGVLDVVLPKKRPAGSERIEVEVNG